MSSTESSAMNALLLLCQQLQSMQPMSCHQSILISGCWQGSQSTFAHQQYDLVAPLRFRVQSSLNSLFRAEALATLISKWPATSFLALFQE
jgi:hypothetical protein